MSNNTIASNDIANYIHDVAKMEKSVYILNQTKNNYLLKAQQLTDKAIQNCNEAEQNRKKAEDDLKHGKGIEKMLTTKEKITPKSFFKKIFGAIADSVSWFFKFISNIYDNMGWFPILLIAGVLLLASTGIVLGLMVIFPAIGNWGGLYALLLGIGILLALISIVVMLMKSHSTEKQFNWNSGN